MTLNAETEIVARHGAEPMFVVKKDLGEGRREYGLFSGSWYEGQITVWAKDNFRSFTRVDGIVTNPEIIAALNAETLDPLKPKLLVCSRTFSGFLGEFLSYYDVQGESVDEVYAILMRDGVWHYAEQDLRVATFARHRGVSRDLRVVRNLPVEHITPEECSRLMVHCHECSRAKHHAMHEKWFDWFARMPWEADRKAWEFQHGGKRS